MRSSQQFAGYDNDRWPIKSQEVRLLDVFVFGPVMLVAAAKLPKKHKALRAGLGLIGAGTVV